MGALDRSGEVGEMLRRLRDLETQNPQLASGDSGHAGAGTNSLQLGASAAATGDYSLAFGGYAWASDDFGTAFGAFAEATGQNATSYGCDASAQGDESTAVGVNAVAGSFQSVALGRNAIANDSHSAAIGTDAQTTADNQVRLGTSADTVSVPGDLVVTGTFSNPSARHLKRDITPAPDLQCVFPELVEYEYIDGDGGRRLGYIADDLVGTDAERFVKFDGNGAPAAIDYLGLLIAQNAQLLARIIALENKN